MVDAQAYQQKAHRFLRSSGDRNLDEARQYLSDDAEFIFPNGRFGSLEEVVEASRGRYRRIGKATDTWDVADHPDGTVVVISVGTLHGENAHGVPFSGIRYIDRITFRGGRIVRQEVWNDLAESGVLVRTAGS